MKSNPVDPFATSPTADVARSIIQGGGSTNNRKRRKLKPSHARRVLETYDFQEAPALRDDIRDLGRRYGSKNKVLIWLLKHGLAAVESGKIRFPEGPK